MAPFGKSKFWKELLIQTVGMMVSAAAIYYFMVPSNLVMGNVSGFAIVVSSALASAGINIKVSALVLILNAFLLILSWFLIGSEFGTKTAFTALVLGPMMDLWEKICPYEKLIDPSSPVHSVMGDLWFDLICYVLVLGASQAIMFSINSSTGGLDIVAKILNKYFNTDIGTAVTVSGIVVCCTAFFVNPFRIVVIGIIGTWINGLIVDHFMATLSRRKRVCIISNEHERIREYIVNNIRRGCSMYEVTGGYSGEKSVEIQSLLTQSEFGTLMKWMRDNNINAFITAGNVSEVYGLWNNKHKHLI